MLALQLALGMSPHIPQPGAAAGAAPRRAQPHAALQLALPHAAPRLVLTHTEVHAQAGPKQNPSPKLPGPPVLPLDVQLADQSLGLLAKELLDGNRAVRALDHLQESGYWRGQTGQLSEVMRGGRQPESWLVLLHSTV